MRFKFKRALISLTKPTSQESIDLPSLKEIETFTSFNQTLSLLTFLFTPLKFPTIPYHINRIYKTKELEKSFTI